MSAVATASPQETARPAPVRTRQVLIGGDGTPPSPLECDAAAELARRLGLDAAPLVTDDPETPRLAKERDSAALVVGADAHPVLLFREPTRHPA